MILDENQFKLGGKNTEINCKCDYCGINFIKKKNLLQSSRKNSNKDSCGDKLCVTKKRNETNLKKYGCENISQSSETKTKKEKTCLENYGCNYPMKSSEIKDKVKKTNLKKYGCENISQSSEAKTKKEKTNLENYGCKNVFQSPKIKNKIIKNNIIKYGKEHFVQTNIFLDKSTVSKILKYGTPYPNKYGKTQKEIQEWLNGFGYNFQSNCKILQGKEIDLYDENLKLAIEYCGLFWHTENSPQPRDKKYHYDKYKKCLENNVRLITIYEDEWLNRKSQVQNLLKSILNKFTVKLFARKCVIKEIDKIIANNFINDYHIQGSVKSIKFASGIYYNEELLGCISLGNHHRNNEDLVLNRLCFKTDVQIVGGASKLFSRCISYIKENKINKIISWSDNRYSQGNVYNKLNFRLDKELLPDYSYINLSNTKEGRLSKQSCKKKNTKCPEDLTEREYMYQLGYSRIWDCGKKRWIYLIN